MKLFLLLVIAFCSSVASKAQDCSTAYMQGYRHDTTVTVDEARRVILTSFAAITTCQEKLKLRSGSMYGYTIDGDIVMAENFNSPLDNDTKLRLIGRLKPGMKLMLKEMRYGDDNKLVPEVALTLIKGSSYSFSSK